ncbi:hypothetical protein [Fodinicurvata sp. EGI_FJ10296]|uniref:hypothetical protein n=1 Tax=Fodinicurvata sp. EGI_FJ10296 TaxID=3231908 RepID=UPI00345160F8
MRRLVKGLATASVLVGLAGVGTAGWSLLHHPVGQWLVPVADTELRSRLRTAVASEVSDEWLEAELESALADNPVDWVDIGVLEEIRDEQALSVSPELDARLDEARPGFASGAMSCARCMVQPSACDLQQLFYCRLPIELTPIGDVSILASAGANAARGDAVDGFDVALATIGLGATALALPSGGSSIGLKAGAATMKLARNAGLLSARLLGEVRTLASRLVRWDRAPVGLSRFSGTAWAEAMDPAAMAQVQRLGGDLGVLAGTMSPAHAATLLRGADTIDDVSGLSRIARVQGEGAVRTVRVLGKSRALRAGMRLSRTAMGILAGIAGFLLGVAGLVGSLVQSIVSRRLAR